MDQQKISQVLQDLIIAIDPTNFDMNAFYEAAVPYLESLSDELHVARMETLVHINDNPFAPKDLERRRVLGFHDDPGPEADALKLVGGKLYGIESTTILYPWNGYHWNDEERKAITAIGRLLYAQASRISMIQFEQRSALTDQLTGMNNIGGALRFCGRIAAEVGYEGYAGCFLNLKNLKYLNRQLDNSIGDHAMRQYAANLNALLDPQREQLARLGGDNFFALVRMEHLDEFVGLAVSMPLEIDFRGRLSTITLGAWVGIYVAKGGEKPRDLLDFSSFAYEVAKRTKVTVAYYSPEMMEASLHARKVAQQLPLALERGELVPFYQPKVSLHTGDLQGCEALMRWVHKGKVLTPAEFLPVAEDSEMITALDLYMLEAVCKDLRYWLDAGIEPVPVSINYSQKDFYRETLVSDTLGMLEKYHIDGSYLEIEITESSFFENYAALEQFIEAMHGHGVRVSLDDFGTGYSSLTLFESLNLDTVKLDRSFFLNMDKKGCRGELVLRSVADMLNKLNKVTVSEGVETPDQLALVENIGGDIVQGFYFDRPMPRDDFTLRLKERHYKTK